MLDVYPGFQTIVARARASATTAAASAAGTRSALLSTTATGRRPFSAATRKRVAPRGSHAGRAMANTINTCEAGLLDRPFAQIRWGYSQVQPPENSRPVPRTPPGRVSHQAAGKQAHYYARAKPRWDHPGAAPDLVDISHGRVRQLAAPRQHLIHRAWPRPQPRASAMRKLDEERHCCGSTSPPSVPRPQHCSSACLQTSARSPIIPSPRARKRAVQERAADMIPQQSVAVAAQSVRSLLRPRPLQRSAEQP